MKHGDQAGYGPHRQSTRECRWLRAACRFGPANDPRVGHRLSALRHCKGRSHADRRLPVLLYLQWLWREAATEAGRLLRVLLLRLGAVPADPGAAGG